MDASEILRLYDLACEKAARNSRKIGSELREFPASETGDYFSQNRASLRGIEHIFGWTQSFFTGMALLAGAHTGNFSLIRWCERFYPDYRDKVFKTPENTMHDLGFLYTLYSTMLYKLTGDTAMRTLSIRAAEVLAHRYLPACRCIRAWGRMDDLLPGGLEEELKSNNFFTRSKGLAIIDCMMNLPLLFWASKETHDPFFRFVACAHADTTLRWFIREDGSVCHAYRFDPDSGEPVGEFNDCGYSVGSFWARGAAWAVYGFALAWRYTGFRRYRDAALKIAHAYLDACGDAPIPVWDFRLPPNQPARYGGYERSWDKWDITKMENRIYNVDTSAAAIMSCAILELDPDDAGLRNYVNAAVDALAGYMNTDPDCPGLLAATNGTNTYGCYGDYFAMELLARLHGEAAPG